MITVESTAYLRALGSHSLERRSLEHRDITAVLGGD
jgi:hypothetical protein